MRPGRLTVRVLSSVYSTFTRTERQTGISILSRPTKGSPFLTCFPKKTAQGCTNEGRKADSTLLTEQNAFLSGVDDRT